MFKSLKSITFGVLAATLMAGVAHADITVYTAGPQGLIDKLSAGFTKQTGARSTSSRQQPARSWLV